ncbi:MAG: STAS domain-containing protein [Ruminiclostridium sp.]|nr:STAS domain-containing protein [Ruminiclostridium sp.]
MTIKKIQNGNEVTLALEGWLDTQAAPELLAELEKTEDGINSMVFDFSGLEYIASTGVRAVVFAYKKMNGALTVKGASPRILNIFKTTGIDKTVHFE